MAGKVENDDGRHALLGLWAFLKICNAILGGRKCGLDFGLSIASQLGRLPVSEKPNLLVADLHTQWGDSGKPQHQEAKISPHTLKLLGLILCGNSMVSADAAKTGPENRRGRAGAIAILEKAWMPRLDCPLAFQCSPAAWRLHSFRRATMGSTFVARRAGR